MRGADSKIGVILGWTVVAVPVEGEDEAETGEEEHVEEDVELQVVLGDVESVLLRFVQGAETPIVYVLLVLPIPHHVILLGNGRILFTGVNVRMHLSN